MTNNSPNRLTIQRIDEGDVTTFLLEGTVDEHAKLGALAERAMSFIPARAEVAAAE